MIRIQLLKKPPYDPHQHANNKNELPKFHIIINISTDWSFGKKSAEVDR